MTNESGKQRGSNRKNPDGAPAKRRGVYLAVSGILVLAVVGVLIWQLAPETEALDSRVTPTATGFQTPAPTAPVSLSTEADASDVFDWWNVESPLPEVKFLASDDAHDGDYALVVTSALQSSQGTASHLEQTIPATAGNTYTVGFWVKSVEAAEAAIQISPNPNWGERIIVPSGTYDWTYISKDYTVPADQAIFSLRIVVSGSTDGTWIDGIGAVELGSTDGRFHNASFESNSADLTITNATLLFNEDQGSIDVRTRRSESGWFQWAAYDAEDKLVEDGEALIEGYVGQADLATLPIGMYRIDINGHVGGKVIQRSTSLAVLPSESFDSEANDSPFGVFLHYLGGEPRLGNLVESLSIAGIRHARVEMNWPAIEQSAGVYTYEDPIEGTLNRLEDSGIDALLVPVYGNSNYDAGLTPSSAAGLDAYAEFAKDVSAHYSSIGRDMEVYNEFDHIFNSGRCGTTPDCYMQMLSVTAEAVKSGNPDAVIVAPGNSGMGFKFDWLQEFFNLGGLQYTDVVSAHPYVQPGAPEELEDDFSKLFQMIRDANGGEAKPVWLTEMGWASVPDFVTKEEQANYLVRTMALALGNGVERVYWFEAASLNLNEGDRESNFGLFAAPTSFLPNTNEPKLAAVAQAIMARELEGHRFATADDVGDGAYSYVFSKGDDDVRVMWSPTGTKNVEIKTAKKLVVTDILGRSTSYKPKDGVVLAELSETPIYVHGSIASVSPGDEAK